MSFATGICDDAPRAKAIDRRRLRARTLFEFMRALPLNLIGCVLVAVVSPFIIVAKFWADEWTGAYYRAVHALEHRRPTPRSRPLPPSANDTARVPQ